MIELSRRALLALGVTAFAESAFGSSSTRVLAKGTPFETTMRLLDSGRSGPTVLIVAGIHGNEPAPPRVACELAPPERGRLWVLPRANRPALAAGSRFMLGHPHADLNRNFPHGPRRDARGALARALWAATVAIAPDWVLDLHEGWGYSSRGRSMGSSIVWVPDARVSERTEPLTKLLLARVNETIERPHKRFTLLQPGPGGSFARSVTEVLAIPSLVFETTWIEPMDVRVRQQHLLVSSALDAIGLGSVHRGAAPLCPAG